MNVREIRVLSHFSEINPQNGKNHWSFDFFDIFGNNENESLHIYRL